MTLLVGMLMQFRLMLWRGVFVQLLNGMVVVMYGLLSRRMDVGMRVFV